VITVCAIICGADTRGDIEEYERAKYKWLKRFLPLPQGIPSHETCARVFARLAPEAFRPCFLAWLTIVWSCGHASIRCFGRLLTRLTPPAEGRSPV
jgi:hypothetical protein